ncbi:MAG: metalloregulator ArsR/SmtB family transcription factor [Thioalkalispiraceae bacterium]|jgi:ArsR family transcriptional regulator
MSIKANTFFSALANEIRLRTLVLLQTQGELCVCELTHALKLSQPMISRHLALLRDCSLVVDRREGQWIYYQVNPGLPNWAHEVLQTTAQANIKKTPFAADKRVLNNMPNRPAAACCA